MTMTMTCERIAPQGKWRVIAHNPTTQNEWVLDDCKTQIAAYARMQDESRDDTSMEFLIFSDVGEIVFIGKTGVVIHINEN